MSENQEAKSYAECCASRCDGKMVDEDGEELYSLQDVIENENKSNEIARAVLGASDSVNCSYDKGYVYRQALYGCQTCYNQTKHLHGLCLACSYNCHKDHILYELYTKRNFRCDCGNSKFDKDFKCKLKPNKDPTNESNKYNHNFNGLYCDCNKPYETLADEQEAIVNDDNDDDEMIQCAICEDWYHLNHLKGYCDRVVDYNEIVCHNCMKSNNYLWHYRDFMALAYLDSKTEASQTDEVDILNTSKKDERDKNTSTCLLESLKQKYANLKATGNVDDVDADNECKTCFFLNGWRDGLCRCQSCLNMYTSNGCSFLVNSDDTIDYYEKRGKEQDKTDRSTEDDENRLLSDELSKLNRVSQVEFLSNLNEFKQELKDFLADFASSGKVVKRENILEFFDDLNQRKRQKLDSFESLAMGSCK